MIPVDQPETIENLENFGQTQNSEVYSLVQNEKSGESGIAKIGLNATSLIFQIINFIILFIVLKKFLFKPVSKYLDERRAIIEESLKNAQKIAEQKQQWEEEKQKLLDVVNQNSLEIISVGKAEAQKIKQEHTLQTQAEQKKIIETAKLEIEAFKQKSISEAKKYLADLVLEATKKVVGRSFNYKSNDQIIKNTIKELE